MTVKSSVGNIVSRGPLEALRNSMPRDEFFAALALLGCANGIGASAIQSVNSVGWIASFLNTFGISAIVWIAVFLAIADLLRDKTDRIRSEDLIVGAGFLLLVMVPLGQASWVAQTGLGIYLFIAKGSSSRRRAAILLVAITVPMLWARLLFNLFANLLLEFDASLVAFVLGTTRSGAIVSLLNGPGYLAIFPACSSVANISLALLCWVTISVSVGHKQSIKDIFWCALICMSVLAVNITRLSLMGLSIWHFENIHSSTGDMIANLTMFALSVGFSMLGVRRELFSRV